MVEKLVLAPCEAVKVFVREVVRTVVVKAKLKRVQLVGLGDRWLEM